MGCYCSICYCSVTFIDAQRLPVTLSRLYRRGVRTALNPPAPRFLSSIHRRIGSLLVPPSAPSVEPAAAADRGHGGH
jgi:hypothetical protein